MPYLGRCDWTVIFSYYLVMLLLCFFGAYNAYAGPLSSEAWQCWNGKKAYLPEFMRALVFSGIGAIILGRCPEIFFEKIRHQESNQSKKLAILALFPKNLADRIIFAVVFIIIIVLLFKVGTDFKDDLSEKCEHNVKKGFTQIWLPYIPYLLYVVSLWIGIVLVTIRLWVLATYDNYKNVMNAREQLHKNLDELKEGPTSVQLKEIKIRYWNFIDLVKTLVGKIFILAVGINFLIFHEILTSVSESVTERAVAIAQTIGWVTFIAVLLSMVLSFRCTIGAETQMKRILSEVSDGKKIREKYATRKELSDLYDWLFQNMTSTNVFQALSQDVTIFITIFLPILLLISPSLIGEYVINVTPDYIVRIVEWLYSAQSREH